MPAVLVGVLRGLRRVRAHGAAQLPGVLCAEWWGGLMFVPGFTGNNKFVISNAPCRQASFETSYYNTKAALLIALLIRWRGDAGEEAREDERDDDREPPSACRAAVISARRRRVSSSRQSAASAFDRSSAISEISYLDFRHASQALRIGP